MAVPPAAAQTISPFPTPPVYAANYTTERIASGDPLLLPPCVHADFTVFGEEYHLNDEIIRPLADTGIKQLYVNKKEWKAEMKKLNSSAAAAFVDLVTILITSPDSKDRTDKLDDIRDIFINMHHLINEFRPIQARDTLRMMQQKQLEELQMTVDDFKDFLSEAKKTFRQSLKVDDVVRLPVPAFRPDLEDPEVREDPKKAEEARRKELEAAMSGLNVGSKMAMHHTRARPEQQQLLVRKREIGDAVWNAFAGVDDEKMET